MMIKKFFFAAVFFLSCAALPAQNFHITVFGGVSNYQGDLQDKKFTLQESHPAVGFGSLYEITDNLFARANVTFGTVSGDDKKSDQLDFRQRNLSFSSPITDVNLGLEYNLLNLYQHRLTPYIFAGISYFHFNPSAIDTSGKKVYLQPLGTEGEGFYDGRTTYSLNQIAIPFGGGFKFAITNNIHLGIEVGLRKLFTDYLDDVSATYADKNLLLTNNGPEAVALAFRGGELNTGLVYPPAGTVRGNPKSKDWYYFSVITLGFRIASSGDGGSGNRSQLRCPTRIL